MWDRFDQDIRLGTYTYIEIFSLNWVSIAINYDTVVQFLSNYGNLCGVFVAVVCGCLFDFLSHALID